MRLQKLLWRQMQLRMVRRLQCIFLGVLKPAGIKVTRLARGQQLEVILNMPMKLLYCEQSKINRVVDESAG